MGRPHKMRINSSDRESRFRRKLIEKYSRRRFILNSRPLIKKVRFMKPKKSKQLPKKSEKKYHSDSVKVKLEPQDFHRPDGHVSEHILSEEFEAPDAFVDISKLGEAFNDTLNFPSSLNGDVEKWNLVSSLFHSYLFDKVISDLSFSPSKKRKKKRFRLGRARKTKLENPPADPYLSQNFEEEIDVKETLIHKVALLVHLGINRPIFPQFYRNIMTHCGIKNDQVDQISDSWADFALSTLIDENESRIKPVVFPVTDKKLLNIVEEFNNANAIRFHRIEVTKEISTIPQAESARTVKPDPDGFDLNSMRVELEGSPTKHTRPPFIVSNVRSLSYPTFQRSSRQRKIIERDYDAICSAKPYYFNSSRVKYCPAAVDWDLVAKAKGFNSCRVVLERINWNHGENKVDARDGRVDNELQLFAKMLQNDSFQLSEINNQKVIEEDKLLYGNNYFGYDQCTRTYGIMIDYVFRNKSAVFLYRTRKSLKFQSKYNKYFQQNIYVRVQKDTLEEEFVDLEEDLVESEPFLHPAVFSSNNPLKVFRILTNAYTFGSLLLKDANAVTRHTNEIHRVDQDALRSVTNVKWIILELNSHVEDVIFKDTEIFPASLLFEIIYRADLSKMLVYSRRRDFARPSSQDFGVYGVPGLSNAVIIGPINVTERVPILGATIRQEDGTLCRIDFEILSVHSNQFSSPCIVKAWWWRPGTNDSGINGVMDAFLNYHFKFRIDPTETSKNTLKIGLLMLTHNALSYVKMHQKGAEANYTLIHDKILPSMRSQGMKPLPITDLSHVDDDDNNEDEAIAIDPPIEEEAEDEEVKSDAVEATQRLPYKNKLRRERKRPAKLSGFCDGVIKKTKRARRRFVPDELKDRRIIEQSRRDVFGKHKFYLCWTLDESPESISLNALILKAVSEIKKLSSKNKELEAKKIELTRQRNRLDVRLMKLIDASDPNSTTCKSIKQCISKKFNTSYTFKNFDVDAQEDFIDKIYDMKKQKRRTASKRIPFNTDSISQNEDQIVCRGKKMTARKSTRGGNSRTALTNLSPGDVSFDYLQQSTIIKNQQKKIIALRDHDYLKKKNKNIGRSSFGVDKHIRVVLLEFSAQVYSFGIKKMVAKTDDPLTLIRKVIDDILDDIKKQVDGRKLENEPSAIRFLRVLKAMLNLDLKLSMITQHNDEDPKYIGASVTTVVSLNHRYICRIICDDFINDTNMQLRCGLDNKSDIQESRYIDNALIPKDIKGLLTTTFDELDSTECDDILDEPKKHVSGIIRRSRKLSVVETSQNATSDMASKDSLLTFLQKSKGFIVDKNGIPVSYWNKLSKNILPKLVIPSKQCLVKLMPQSASLNHKNGNAVKWIKCKETRTSSSKLSYSSVPILEAHVANKPNILSLSTSQKQLTFASSSTCEKAVEVYVTGDSENSLLNLLSRTSGTELAQNSTFDNCTDDLGNESDSSLTSINLTELKVGPPTNVVKLRK